MEPQAFFIRTGTNDLASYKISIPLMNMTDEYNLEVKTDAGEIMQTEKAGSCDYAISRNDGPGKYKMHIAIKTKDGTVTEEKAIEVVVSKGHSPELVAEVEKAIEKLIESGNIQKFSQEVSSRLRGEDIAIVCDLYFKLGPLDWRKRCLAYLCSVSGNAQIRNCVTEFTNVIQHALDANESMEHKSYIVSASLGANLFPAQKFGILFRVLQNPNIHASNYSAILCAIKDITPSSERSRVAARATELLLEVSDVNLRLQALTIINAFGFREALPTLREILLTTKDLYVSRTIVPLMRDWNDTLSAPQLLELLELTSDLQLVGLILPALKQFNYRQAIPKIQEMIPVSGVDKAKAIENGIKDWK